VNSNVCRKNFGSNLEVSKRNDLREIEIFIFKFC